MSSPQLASQKCSKSPNNTLSNGKPAVNLELRNFDTDNDTCVVGEATVNYEYSHPERTRPTNPFPAELDKTIICFCVMSAVLLFNLISTAIIHDRTPNKFQTWGTFEHDIDEGMRHPPLRDVSFDLASRITHDDTILMTVSEVMLIITTTGLFGLLTFHRHKSIIFRRMFFLVSLLFSVRLITMNATMLPISNGSLYQCAAKQRYTTLDTVFSRLLGLASQYGLAFPGSFKFCGNYIYSGHTVILILNSLMADEYCPFLLVNWCIKLMTTGSTILILMSGFDYTISVIIAYYATTRVFWLYHTLANNPSLKKISSSNQLCKEWWFPIFQFLEGNVKGVVPSNYNLFR